MHPVLARAVHPLADEVAAASQSEAQISPEGDFHRWSAQAVVEHLILDFKRSTDELRLRLKTGRSPSFTGSTLQWILKIQTCFFGLMSHGVSTSLSLRPGRYTPQDGHTLAARLIEAADQLDKVLAQCRISFGMRPCGHHPIYGPLRVEQWRVYHATHCRHHQRQFQETLRYARRNGPLSQPPQPDPPAAPTPEQSG